MAATCSKCRAELDIVSFHCKCGDMAEFECRKCSFFRTVSITTPPSCHSCQTPMVERGYRPGDEPKEPEVILDLSESEGIDYERMAAEAGWEKFLVEPGRSYNLTLKQQRRLQSYDILIWRIDQMVNPPKREIKIWR